MPPWPPKRFKGFGHVTKSIFDPPEGAPRATTSTQTMPLYIDTAPYTPTRLYPSEGLVFNSEVTVGTSDHQSRLHTKKDSHETDRDEIELKRKKILLKAPEGTIFLGEISYWIRTEHQRLLLTNDMQMTLVICDRKINAVFALEVLFGTEVRKTTLPIRCQRGFCGSITDHLLAKNYIWALEDMSISGPGTITLKIGVLKEKAPIVNAKRVVSFFTGRKLPSYNVNAGREVDSIETFLKEMHLFQKKNEYLRDVNVQHEKLKPTLCPYQMKAVQWMLKRESPDLEPLNWESWFPSVIEIFPTYCMNLMFYNVYSESIFFGLVEFPSVPRGGILADEMGLGKTVAIIALILNNPRNMNNETDTGEFLIPLPNENVKKVCPLKIRRKDFDPAFSLRAKNMESHLSPHEELVLSKARKGTAMKQALNKWYESTLAEYSATTPSKAPQSTKTLIKCLCGDPSPKKDDHCVECKECKRLQHASCVGFQENCPYFCPLCWSGQKLVKSNATLIISPSNIYNQWLEEINKHVDPSAFPNGIFMYDDLKSKFIQPYVLASYDLVICTYSRLRAELNHTMRNESSRKLRNEERFLKQCSPVAQINWWRLCLDEAQMVEADSSAISQMAKLIPAVNRWSVTGTPIQKSVNDMYHLMDFLRVEPFTDKYIWNTLLYTPYIHGNKLPLCSTVSQIFWRNSKDDVSEEMYIPDQTVRYHTLKFTAIEQSFYMREHTASSSEFAEALRRSKLDVTTKLDSLDKNTLNKLLSPLLNLRQACSHFLAVKGNKISTKTGCMTMTDLFKYLYNKTKVECEEELRKYIAAINGVAGILAIRNDWPNAAEYYRRVLRICDAYKKKVHVDSLQRIHTLTNLAEVLEHHGEGIEPTLRDSTLLNEAKKLEDKYMEKVFENYATEQRVMSELSTKVSELEQKFSTHSEVWWAHLITILALDNGIEEVIDKVSSELLATQMETQKSLDAFISKISSPKLIEVLMRTWLKNIKDNRRKVMARLHSLKEMSANDLLSQAVDCHLRSNSSNTKRPKCALCICENDLLDYECCLFAVSRKVLKAQYERVLDGAQTKGSWKPHKAERVLSVILNVAKNKPSSEKWAVADGKNHMSLLEAMKKEFKQLRALWMNLNHQIQARDEISMCKLRLRLNYPGEPLPPKPTKLNLREHNKGETIYIIRRHEIPHQFFKLTEELQATKSGFYKKYGTLLYLDNVGKSENATPEPCPVCKLSFQNQWCVLQCGHCYCIECIRTLLMRSSRPTISCPVCREITASKDLCFIDLSGRDENPDIPVVGEHSTKIEAVTRTLLELKQNDENVKVLIFSSWTIVLKVLAVALEENGISYRRMPGYNYQIHLKEFKDPKRKITALLLPLAWGSKGLNLTEATHVFLIEPVMNPAEELQALGRVHRIGQTKETVVHRFLVKGTIEEKIYSTINEARDKWNKKDVTLEDLNNLFDIKQDLVANEEPLPGTDYDI